MGVDEDKKVCDGFREREGIVEEGPGVRICVEDDGEKRRGVLWRQVSGAMW